jgi:hypothetical protein
VAEDQSVYTNIVFGELLEGGEHEHGRFTHTGLCLADDIRTKDCLGNALLLNCLSGRIDRVSVSDSYEFIYNSVLHPVTLHFVHYVAFTFYTEHKAIY